MISAHMISTAVGLINKYVIYKDNMLYTRNTLMSINKFFYLLSILYVQLIMDMIPRKNDDSKGQLEFTDDINERLLAKHICYDQVVKKLTILRQFEVMVFYGQIISMFLYIVFCKLFMTLKGSKIDQNDPF